MNITELERKYKEMGDEIERLKAKDEPKVGDFCKFWDKRTDEYMYGNLLSISEQGFPYSTHAGRYMNCEKADFSPDDISFVEAMNNPSEYEINWDLNCWWKRIDILDVLDQSLGKLAGRVLNIRIRRIKDK